MEAVPEDPILEFLPDTLVAIRKIYNLENGRMAQSVAILDKWIKKQRHFANTNFCPEYLEKSIIACKGSVEKAKMQIDKLCTYKTLLPKFFLYTDVKGIFANTEGLASVVPLPKMTKDYQRIFLIKLYDKEFTSEQLTDYYRLNLIITEYLKRHDYVNGFIILEDFREANLTDILSKLSVTELQQYLSIIMEGFGAKMKGIHILTQSKVIDILVKTMKPMLTPKLAQRIYVHREIEDLHQVVDKKILPVDLEGSERSIKELQDKWMEVLSSEENINYLEDMQASNCDESLRQTDKFIDQHMSIPGSFRTLSVD